MASIGSIMGGGSTGSVYGNRNILSGLASGMDTESMIENAIQGHKMKLSLLQQQRTVVQWQQSAYQKIIEKMVSFNQKYTSFSGGNNLSSESFFDNAIDVITGGANADKISASGKTTSQIEVLGVSSLASDAQYAVGVDQLAPSNVAAEGFKLEDAAAKVGTLSGSLQIGYGGKTVSVDFNDKDIFENGQDMVDAINKKLEGQTLTFQGGAQHKASDKIQAKLGDNGEILIVKRDSEDSNDAWISGATGNVGDKLGIEVEADDRSVKSFAFKAEGLTEITTAVDLMNEKGFEISLDGVSKTVKGPSAEELEKLNKDGHKWDQDDYISLLQKNIDDAFGTRADGTSKLKVDFTDGGEGKVKFRFTAPQGSEGNTMATKFSVSSAAGKQIGMENAVTSYVNPRSKLGSLMPGSWDSWRIKADVQDADVTDKGGIITDSAGNRLIKETKQDGTNVYYKADENGNALVDFKINGKSIGTFTQESTLQEVMNEVNSNENSDVKMAYSQFSNKFTFTSKISGAGGKVTFGDDDLAGAMFGGGTMLREGKDASFTVNVNGVEQTVTHSGNTVDIDGLKITLKETFETGSEAVTFKTKVDADKIVDVVKDMVKDYNEMAKLIKDTYTSMPQTNSKGKPYMPLTDEERKDMSESEIKAFEERAKQGILFADRDLSNLYTGLQNALSALGATGTSANEVGLTTSFSDGSTTIELSESQLRKALDQNPEKIKDMLTRSAENGGGTDGLMIGLKKQLERFAATTGAQKGILVEKAGSPLAPTSIFQNELQKKLGNFDRQINLWQTKLGDQIDYYNRKFTALEVMISEMNNQSSMLMGLGGGY